MKPDARDIIDRIKGITHGPNHLAVRNAHPLWHKKLLMEPPASREYIKTLLDGEFTMREWAELHSLAEDGTVSIQSVKEERVETSSWEQPQP